MTSTNNKAENLPSFDIVAKLATRTLRDENGNTYLYVDEELRNRLNVRLIARTLAFRVA